MPDWAISLLIGIVLTYMLMGALVLIGRFEDKKIREHREGGKKC
ncbi:hypothetical protein P8631_11710 [Guyparkeria sp. 1SP6A2]|nr:hypothetical protein [Guyparkeria sp. 1SP6A2]